MKLNELLNGRIMLPEKYNCELTSITLDSRQVTPGALFFASAGSRTHGAQFIDDAIANGAGAIITAGDTLNYSLRAGVPIVMIPDLTHQIGIFAARFYHNPTRYFKNLIGVTGTNGKTSISYLLSQILQQFTPCTLIGTLGIGFPGQLAPATHTTPDALTLQNLFAEWARRDIRHTVMEVSSHALDQGRVAGINFNIAIFTNLTRDHLDYHGDMESYGQAKRRLFHFPEIKYAVINTDDAFGRRLITELSAHIQAVSYGFNRDYQKNYLHVCGTDLSFTPNGLQMTIISPWGSGIINSAWLGRFNALNLLAVFATLGCLGMKFKEAGAALQLATVVPGRMETFGGNNAFPLIVVDYAHTPDALEQVLRALREYIQLGNPNQKLWCVFGCGGERDRGKRPLMGAVAAQYADQIILTNDNPRGDDPEEIIRAILSGMPAVLPLIIPDRAQAIQYAIQAALPGDVVLIAGKGHEKYQQIGTERLPFSDQDEVRRIIKLTSV